MAGERHAGEDGAALVEAALVLPILLLLVFVVLEISLYLWNSGLAFKAVQLGVRRAVVSDPVAFGPGLVADESRTYWDGLPPGQSCFPTGGKPSLCPHFAVTCSTKDGCRCPRGACPFRFAAAKLAPILQAMRAVMPDIEPENVEISYATNDLGYVTRPPPVPVDVHISLIDMHYTPALLPDLFGGALPLRASATLPSESLVTR